MMMSRRSTTIQGQLKKLLEKTNEDVESSERIRVTATRHLDVFSPKPYTKKPSLYRIHRKQRTVTIR